MVRVSEKFLEQITLLAKESTTSVDAFLSRLINIADPINPQDAATKSYVDNITVIGNTNLTILAALGTAEDTGFTVLSAFEFDTSDYDGYTSIIFNALIETSNVADAAEIRIFNLTDQYILGTSILSTSSVDTFAVSADITEDIGPGNNTYELQLRLTTTGSPNIAICKGANLVIE